MSSHEESVEQTKQPTLCVKCNSFFSNAACNDLCSKCHRELEASEAKTLAAGAAVEALVRGPVRLTSTSAAAAAATPEQQSSIPSNPAPEASTSSAALDDGLPGGPVKNGPSRCGQCRKKVGLCGFKCKCGQLFCGQHRYAESHSCSFDYKASGRVQLSEANPVVQAAKVQKL